MNTPALAAGFLLFPIAGLCARRSRFVRGLNPAAQVAVCTALGACFVSLELFALSIFHVSWSAVVVALPAVISLSTIRRAGASRGVEGRRSRISVVGILLAAAGLGLLCDALLSGRATSIDYVYFWGTKGFRFAAARAIDVAFLTEPDHYLMHPDYPPLVPLVYAATSIITGSRSWWLGLVGTIVFCTGAVLAIWGFCCETMDSAVAGSYAGLASAAIAIGLIVPYSGGNAEAFLLFFDCVALGLLTAFPRRREAEWWAGMALAGAVLTKIEGSVFALLVVIAFALWREGAGERFRRLVRLGALPFATLALWLAYASHHRMLSWYRQPYGPFTLLHFGPAIREFFAAADYRVAYLPWVAVLLLWLSSPRRLAGLRAALVGAAFAGFALFCFLHGAGDPVGWVHSVAPRLLMNSLVCFLFGAAAAAAPEPRISPSTNPFAG